MRPLISARLLAFYDTHRRLLLTMLVLFYLAGFNGQWRLEPDSALYLSIGRNLAQGLGYTYQGEVHNLAYPGWPWVLAFFFKVFGAHALLAAHGFMLACGLGSLALFYRLMWLVAGRATAVLLTCMTGMTETLFRYAFEMRNETPFLLGVMAFLAGYEGLCPRKGRGGRWWDGALLVVGFAVAVVMRPAVVALLGAVVVAAAWQLIRGGAGRVRPALALGVVVLVIAGFYVMDPRRSAGDAMGLYEETLIEQATTRFGDLARMAVVQNFPRMLDAEIAAATFGTRLGWRGLNLLGSLAVLGAGVWLFRARVIWGAFFVLTVAMIALVPRPEGRYLLAVLPLVAYGWWRMGTSIERRWSGGGGAIVFLLLLGLWVVPNLARVGWVVLEQRQVPFLENYRHGEFAALPALADAIQQHVPAHIPVAAPPKTGRVLSYLSRRGVVDSGAIVKIDPRMREIWVVLPDPDGEIGRMLTTRQLTAGPAVAEVPQRGGRPALTLHRAMDPAP